MIPTRANGAESSTSTEESTYHILGGDSIGLAIAERLQADGHRAVVVDESYEPSDVPGCLGDPAELDVLSESGIETAATVIVATPSDRRNLLIAQLVRAHFDVPRIVTLVTDPSRIPLFSAAGHDPVCATTALSDALVETL